MGFWVMVKGWEKGFGLEGSLVALTFFCAVDAYGLVVEIFNAITVPVPV